MIRYRSATVADVYAVVALVESAYRGEASRLGWTTEADLLDGQRTDAAGVLEVIERPEGRMLLAVDVVDGADGTDGIVGCCQLERRPDRSGYFGMFAIRPERQGAGLGRAMVGEAERLASGWGATELRMSVLAPRVDLIAWYGRLGYAQNGERQPFPYGDERYGLPRVEDLYFVVLTKALPAPR